MTKNTTMTISAAARSTPHRVSRVTARVVVSSKAAAFVGAMMSAVSPTRVRSVASTAGTWSADSAVTKSQEIAEGTP
jgi:hypothetical protein